MDKLDDFIGKNKGAFDDKEPSEKIWRNIRGNLKFQPASPTLWNSVMLWRAAAVVFMVLSLYLLIPKDNAESAPQQAVLKEFNDVEEFYNQQISFKEELISEFQTEEALADFTRDFQQLEAMYTVLKDEMKTRPSKKVKDALVLNLLVRINLLNQQLEKLEDDDKASSKKKEANT